MFIECSPQNVFHVKTHIFYFSCWFWVWWGFFCLVLVYFFNLLPGFLPSLIFKDWQWLPHASQFSIPLWLSLRTVGKTFFFLLFLFHCRFWLELFLALEQVYRLHPVCPDFHWRDRLHHLPLAWLISLCGNAGLPCGVHRGDVRCSAALPKLPEPVDRRNEVWCLSYIKQVLSASVCAGKSLCSVGITLLGRAMSSF